jgi:hypothetical protein
MEQAVVVVLRQLGLMAHQLLAVTAVLAQHRLSLAVP